MVIVIEYLALTSGLSLNDPKFRSQPTAPLTTKLLFIDVDALRADFASDPSVMPTVASLAARGASVTALTSGISLSLCAIKAWTMGVGFRAVDFVRNFWGMDRSADSIFERANLKQMRVEFSGPPEWDGVFQALLECLLHSRVQVS
jgi:predicted AlkP superfamily pyrophosphatase or phosphodiesterase